MKRGPTSISYSLPTLRRTPLPISACIPSAPTAMAIVPPTPNNTVFPAKLSQFNDISHNVSIGAADLRGIHLEIGMSHGSRSGCFFCASYPNRLLNQTTLLVESAPYRKTEYIDQLGYNTVNTVEHTSPSPSIFRQCLPYAFTETLYLYICSCHMTQLQGGC